MFFKTLEIQGFKSFPDKTILHFDTKMTAVVGSNGNGKSNISDALRWVMGEQGAKTLRGDKMEDVIFHGTESRKQMGYAKVALSIDNTDRALGRDSDEVVVTRKLYRTGDSEYLINGVKCRLKDIHEMLMGTGLGRDGYSIIGQGRVAEIINSKGKDRREFFDEAAGVSKFLHKKAEAEHQLEKANDNLLRLWDIEKELQDRLPILERQAEKAIKAKAYIEEEKKIEISVNVAEINRINREMFAIDNDILMNEGECEHFDREIAELEKLVEEKTTLKMRLSMQVETLRRESDSVKDEISENDKKAALLENEIIHNKARIKVLEEQIENSKTNEQEFLRQIASLDDAIKAKLAEIDTLEQQTNEKKAELEQLSLDNEKLDSEYKTLDRELTLLYAKQTEAKLTLRQAEERKDELSGQLSETEERTQNQDDVIAEYRAKRREIRAALDNTTQQKNENENKLAGYERIFQSKSEKLESSKTEYEQLRRTYEQKKSRFDVLSDIERNMAGYSGSVKAIVNAARAGKISGIHGPVADILHVDKKYGIAIETALGAALQNIIVENEEAAKRSIRFLKDTNGGRATFLPLTSIKGKAIDFPSLYDEDGFLGFAFEVVQFDPKYRSIVLSVLGKTAVCDDIDTATFLAKKYGYKFRIVTLDGQIINAGGSFTGGSSKESSGIISRKQEIEELGKELQKSGDTLELLKGNHSELLREVNKMSIEMEGYKEQITAYKSEEIRLTAEVGGIDNLIKQCEEQQDNAEALISRHKSQIAAQQTVIEKLTEELSDIEQKIDEQTKLAEQMGSSLETALATRARISDDISALGIEILGGKKDVENLTQQKANTEQNKVNLSQGNTAFQKEIAALQEQNIALHADIETARQQIKEITKSFSDNQQQITDIIGKSNELEREIGDTNREIREKIEDKEKFSNALVVARERKNTAEREIDTLKSSLWEKYEISPSEAKEAAEDIDNINEAKNQLSEVRKKISALGSINFAAIEEFAEVKERYETLSGQISDVEQSKDDLEKLITNLTTDIKAQFLRSFNEINTQFGRIFTEIFGGGKAHLELTDPEDILGSGIEIFAAPPGKVIKNLISLSGGEQTMVAITIYFAILLHRPTPFCMLDEVDAALDDVNVTKYITYLKQFSDQTQLMIITHRRGTIEGCDVLYGVYMQEKGVSRLLKQELIDNLELD